ncbi:MAG TPA: MFS transporter [Anaeromyxobacter sp.]|jgi:MFS family permease|nr:MFS transporter [Anaeromyxobacter sp.]
MRTAASAIAAHFRGFPPRFWWLWAGAVVSAFATFVFLFLAVYLAARGFSPRDIGLLVAADGVGSLAAAPVGGWLADRIGRRPTLVAALALCAAAAAFLAFARAPPLVVPGVLAFGLASTMTFPALFAIVADVVPERDLERGFGLLYWANNLGVAFSAAVGGAIGERSWTGLFLADAATTLAFAAIVWQRVPESRPGPTLRPDDTAAASPARGYGAVLRDGPFVGFWVVFVVYLLVFWQFQVAAPLAMARDGHGPAAIGRILMANGIVIFALQPFSARLVARFDPARVLAVAAALVGTGYGAYAICDGVASYAVATAIWSVGEVLTTPVASALVARLAPPDLRGRYQGAYGFAWGAGRTVAPVAGGAALEALGPTALWVGCLGMGLTAALGHLALGSSRRRGTVERRQARSRRTDEHGA